MKKVPIFRETAIRRAARLFIITLASTSMVGTHAAVSLGTAPPTIKAAPEPVPNITLTLDDSGSMAWPVKQDYPYYDTPYAQSRMRHLKEVARDAFSAYDNGKFRLAYQSINGTSSNVQAYSGGFRAPNFRTTEKRNLMKPFEGQHRSDFLAWLNGMAASGGTPLRTAAIRAGEYAMGYVSGTQMIGPADTYQYDGKTFRYDPLNGLDCRRSVHIIMTDGVWNDSLSVPGSFKVNDKPGGSTDGTTEVNVPTPQSGSLGPNTTVVPYSGNIALTNSGYVYTDRAAYTLADLTFNYWATDLRADLNNNVKPKINQTGDEVFTSGTTSKTVPEWWNPKNNPANWQNLQAYTIGFGPVAYLPELKKPDGTYYNDPANYMYVGDYFNKKITGLTAWPLASSDSDNNRYDLWHAAYNGRGKYYAANDPESLKKAFEDILATATAPVSGHATVSASASASRLTSDTMAYIASYKAENDIWTGKLEFWKIGDLGVSNAVALATSSVPAAASRSIVTWRSGTGGIPFQWSNLSSGLNETTSPKLSELNLGTDATIVNAVRGKPLGDIVHSSISMVGRPSGASLAASYRHFAAKINGATPRTRMVYVGANDGMLHGFDAGSATPANPGTGVEKLAYVPQGMIRDLKTYVDPDYKHRYWVDGSPFTGDVQIVAQSSESGTGKFNGWRTILTGTLDAGGKGYFILDVTDPSSFSESNAANLVLLDKTYAATDAAADPDLGHQMHEPVEDINILSRSGQIVQINLDSAVNPGQKQWAVIMGNGINSTNGKPVLLVQTLEGSSKTLYKVDACSISAPNDNATQCEALPSSGAGTNGLLAPRPVDMNGDGTADVVYAGDYRGNVWKFDISSKNASNWKVGLGGSPLFTAQGLPSLTVNNPGTAYRQTLTAAPVVIPHPNGGFMVAFGTGRNINSSDQADNSAANLASYGQRLNTFYGIRDTQHFSVNTQQITLADGTKYYEQTVVLDAATAAPVSSTVQGGGGSRFAALFRRSNGVLGAAGGDDALRKGLTDTNAMPTSAMGWYYDLPEIEFDNATKVLQNPWMLRDNVVAFFSTNVSSESGSADGGAAVESCNVGTRYSPSRTQINYFDLFTGKNPDIRIYSGANDVSANAGDVRYNRYQYDNNPVFIKGSNEIQGTGGGNQRPDFDDRPGKFAGWRIIR